MGNTGQSCQSGHQQVCRHREISLTVLEAESHSHGSRVKTTETLQALGI